MTTGMSAPPIGMMIRTPSRKARIAIIQNCAGPCAMHIHTTSAISAMPSSAFSGCCPGKVMGAPLMMPCSLPKAMIEPVNVTAPIAVPMLISTRLPTGICPNVPIP